MHRYRVLKGRGFNAQMLGPKRRELLTTHRYWIVKCGKGLQPTYWYLKRVEGGYNTQMFGPKRRELVTTHRYWILKGGKGLQHTDIGT